MTLTDQNMKILKQLTDQNMKILKELIKIYQKHTEIVMLFTNKGLKQQYLKDKKKKKMYVQNH